MNPFLLIIIQILYGITIVGIATVVISENRNPVKTLSWVMVLIFLPVIGLALYLVFGQEITKKQVISRRMYSKLKKRPLDEIGTLGELIYPQEHAKLISLFKNLDNTPLLGGNEVRFFITAAQKFESLLEDIENARQSIHVEYYIFMGDEIGNRIQEALIRKSSEGVEVRIIYDAFGSMKTPKSFFEKFRKAGIEAEPFLKFKAPIISSSINYRNHRKIVVIDGEIGYVGGMNISDKYLHGLAWGPWRDTHVRIRGKGVQGLQSIFLIDWYFVSQTLITSRKYFPILPAYGDVLIQTVNSGPFREEREIVHGILQAIYDSEKSILIQTPYFIPTEPMVEALQAAAIRGVDVRVMISKRSDVPLVQLASHSFVKEMLIAGIKVYMYEKGFLHSKLMVFDDSLTLIGSVNFDSRSFEHNFEVESFIYSQLVAQEATAVFTEDWRHASPIRPSAGAWGEVDPAGLEPTTDAV